ncbi:trypsin-like peptidase domain-containing protein [Candidatus Kaiserbacteria bacterium]|nr:trypsin-like peptidase domain-containing protein [Candidatus Kaiserbacteria bacterium]
MPIFALIQIIAARAVIAIVALLTAFGIGSVSDAPSHLSVNEEPDIKVEEIMIPAEETQVLPLETIVSKPKEEIISPNTEEYPEEVVPDTPAAEEVILPEVNLPEPEAPLPLSFSQINTETAAALVNVLCSQNIAGAVNPITGSGVIVDPRGVVITNAHVAQFFLLEDYPIENSLECILRTGSPARNMYTAELLYISPEWVNLHANDIKNSEPKGTGEHDYAFLRITGRTDPDASLPSTFPFIPLDTNDINIKTGNQVLAAAYPAGFLGGVSIQKDLYSVSSIANVGERFTFLENTIDLFSIGGTVVSQGGSSGGAVVSGENKLIGIIVTSTNADTTAERDLRAITLSYINRALMQNANSTVEGLLFGDITLKAKLFNLSTAPALSNLFLPYLAQ